MFLNKTKLFLVISICLIFFFLTYNDVKSYDIKIIDGDTIHLNGKKIRFSGIDTPELKQTCKKNDKIIYCGIMAKKLLIDKIADQKVNCIEKGKDQYKRTLAECFINDLSLSSYLVKKGYAFAYRKYSKKFIKDEDYARVNNLGMWSMNFEFPWDYRKKN
ncbi:thermonuclease family protein [Pelagibacterales bacterium SAG-MED13]|nr:thermonuclease family protein [Pelagibacterales bacterium SAG-MED13]